MTNIVREILWSALVEKADGPGRAIDKYHPIQYQFSNGRYFRQGRVRNDPGRDEPDDTP